MKLAETFFDNVKKQADIIRETQLAAISKAAVLTADAIKDGALLYVYDRGHLLNQELLFRAGGLAITRKMEFNLPSMKSGSTAPECRSKQTDITKYTEDFEDKCIEAAFIQNCLKAGDVLFYNSVSGKGRVPISIAKTAKRLGIKLVILTNKATNERVAAGKEEDKLYKYADVHIDNCVQDGDASMTYEGVDERIIPMSGISAAFVGWAFVSCLVEELNARGIRPTVYRSVSSEGGLDQLEVAKKRYDELGY